MFLDWHLQVKWADPGFPTGDAPIYLLFGENYMKMKENWPGVRPKRPPPPLDTAMKFKYYMLIVVARFQCRRLITLFTEIYISQQTYFITCMTCINAYYLGIK